jgi:hypothetical protein
MASASIAVSGRLVANMLLRELLVLVRVPGPHRPDATTDSSLARLDHVQSQHFAAIFGDYADKLLDLRRLLDIKAVVDR